MDTSAKIAFGCKKVNSSIPISLSSRPFQATIPKAPAFPHYNCPRFSPPVIGSLRPNGLFSSPPVGSASLGNIKNKVATSEIINDFQLPISYKPIRALRNSIKNKIIKKNLPPAGAVYKCGLPLTETGEVSLVRRADESVGISGVNTCASVWHCPYCRAKILNSRQEELKQVVSAHVAAGGGVSMVTLTVRHTKEDSIDQLLGNVRTRDEEGQWKGENSGIRGAFKDLRQDRAWRAIKEDYGYLADCRVYETTWGQNNGYHIHIHMLFFTQKPLLESEMADLREDIHGLWKRKSLNNGLREPSLERGVDVRDGSEAGSYLAKYGAPQEICSDSAKKAKNGNFTIYELEKFLVNNTSELPDWRIEQVLKDYYRCFKGKKLMTWGGELGFKKRYLREEEKTDEELAKADEVGVPEIAIKPNLWTSIFWMGAVAAVVSIYELRGFEGLKHYISEVLGLDSQGVRLISSQEQESIKRMREVMKLAKKFYPTGED